MKRKRPIDWLPDWCYNSSPFNMGRNYYGYILAPHKFFRDIYLNCKWFIQRGYRGYADCDVWNLDNYLCKWMPQALTRLRDNNIGHPFGLTQQSWKNKLQRMINGFEACKKMDDLHPFSKEKYDTLEQIRRRGFRTFSTYFLNLWD